jgi:ParB-like chromosome segregation protein Spo0J
MSKKVRAAFEMQPVVVRLEDLLQTKPLDLAEKQTEKYKEMDASVREVGIIEALVVYPQKGGKFLLLDGHLRLHVLQDLGRTEVRCLVSTDDEAYTYNHKVNRLAPIQANRMIVRALDEGVSDERLARALNRNITTIRQNRSLLMDICPEAIEILKDKQVHQAAIRALKRVKAIRQIEMAELMVSSGTYTRAYAEALVMMTAPDLIAEEETAKKKNGVSRPEDLARMENELKTLEKDFAVLDDSYGRNVVDLTLARGYLKKLLDNGKVVRFLAQRHAEILAEFQRIVEAVSLEG